jgi:glycosyltransferase involved in cell wall biosynthesis
MKICMIFPKDSIGFFIQDSGITFGGATVQLHQIATTVVELGEDVTCLIPSSEQYRDKIDVKYRYIEPYEKNDQLYVKIIGLLKSLKRLKPEYVFQRGLVLSSILFALMCRLIGIKFVFMFAHDIEANGYYQNSRRRARLFRLLLSSAYRLICQSERQRDSIPFKYRAKTYIMKKGLLRREESASSDKKYDASWVARCERWKRPHDFIELARRNPDKRFLMVCSRVDTEIEYFKEISLAAKAAENICFFESMTNDEVYENLRLTRIFCITSDMEGDWPMTVLEAGSCGVPVLSLYFDNDDFLKNGDSGYYCRGSLDEMNERFRELLNSEKIYIEKSASIKRYIDENYNIEKNVKRLMDIIR